MPFRRERRRLEFRAAWPPGSQLQIVAHCDDDLYFMNPTVQHGLAAGAPTTTVYLTAGEADGRNVPYGAPDRAGHPVDHAGYAAARRNGIRSAYAEMATGDRDSRWTTEPARYPDATVDVAVLGAAPHVRLVFVSLEGQAAQRPGDPPRAVDALWSGDIPELALLVPTGSTMPAGQTLTRDGLLDLLVEILAEQRPTVVRVMDPDPDHTSYDRERGVTYSDHAGHTAAALFGLQAVRRFGRHRGGMPAVESYRGYYNRHWPANLTAAAAEAKHRLLDTYGGTHGDRTGPVGCGDYLVGDRSRTTEYGYSTTQRHPGSTSWLRLLADGRLAVLAVRGGHPYLWAELEAGRGWTDARRIAGPGDLTPHLDVVAGPDHRLHVAAVRQPLTPSLRGQRRILVVASQITPGGPFGDWIELGNPADSAPDEALRMREMGMPVLGVHGDGRLQVFVRNFGRGVSSRVQLDDRTWQEWADLGGSGVQEGLAVATGRNRTLSLFAGTSQAILRWDSGADGDLRPPVTMSPREPAGPLTAVREASGRLLLIHRAGGTGAVVVSRQSREGTWPARPAVIGGHGGFGAVAGFSTPGENGVTLLAQRNDQGTLSVSRQPAGSGISSEWSAAGGMFLRSPSVAADADGCLTVAALGTDGVIRVARDCADWVALPPIGASHG